MALENIESVFAVMPRIGSMIRGQPAVRRVLAADDTDTMSLNVVGAAIAAILAANEAEMRLSGEYAATARPAQIDPRGLDRIGEALGLFGIDGLAQTAIPKSAELDAKPWPLLGGGVRTNSFRLDAPGRRILPLGNG